MRSIRKAAILIAAAAVVAIVAVPAMASASNWTKEGSELKGLVWSQEGSTLGAEGSLGVSGKLRLGSAALGNLECPVSATISLNPNSGSGQLKEFSASAGSCTMTGLLKETCGSVTSLTIPSEPLSVTATESGGKPVITTNEEFGFSAQLAGPSCPENFLYVGKLTATPDNAAAMSSVSLSGTFKSYALVGGTFYGLGNTSASGTLSASPAGKYGISKQRTVKIAGTIGWISSYGSMSCPVNGTVTLEPGSEGTLSSLSKGAGECAGSGMILSTCGKATSVSSGATPWALTDQGTSIKITGVSITFGYASKECAETWSGELLAGVDSTTAISNMTPSGTLHSGIGNRSWSGSLNWSPAGVYGL
jgi:hypothetical protein